MRSLYLIKRLLSKLPGNSLSANGFVISLASEMSDLPEYTPEQLELVEKINNLDNYYQVLGIPGHANSEEIKAAYKRLSRLVHTDKNKSPGAKEAFQAVNEAFTVLSDQEGRALYWILYIYEKQFQQSHKFFEFFQRRKRAAEQPEEERENVNAQRANDNVREENSERPRETPRPENRQRSKVNAEQRRSNAKSEQRGPNARWQTRVKQKASQSFKQIFESYFLILFIILSIIAMLLYLTPNRLYSLEKNSLYYIPKSTSNLGVAYFLLSGDWKFQGTWKDFENMVEKEHIANVKSSCHQEINTRDSMMWKARNLNSRKMFQKAHYFKMAACDKLYEYGISI